MSVNSLSFIILPQLSTIREANQQILPYVWTIHHQYSVTLLLYHQPRHTLASTQRCDAGLGGIILAIIHRRGWREGLSSKMKGRARLGIVGEEVRGRANGGTVRLGRGQVRMCVCEKFNLYFFWFVFFFLLLTSKVAFLCLYFLFMKHCVTLVGASIWTSPKPTWVNSFDFCVPVFYSWLFFICQFNSIFH